MLEAMTWIHGNLTNSDNVFITPSPSLPDAGVKASRDAMIAFARTNSCILFDKFSLFSPTNYWFTVKPLAAENIYADGTHLGALGKVYSCAALAKWLSAFDRAGLAGLSSRSSVDVSGKANLSGGNSFSGDQKMSGVLWVTNSMRLTGSAAQYQITQQDDSAQITRISSPSADTFFELKKNSADAFLVISNATGKIAVLPKTYWQGQQGHPSIGHYTSPYFLVGHALVLESNTAAMTLTSGPNKPGEAVLWNSNGVIYMVTSGVGNTWNATNKIAP
jgi:hypothetical protein